MSGFASDCERLTEGVLGQPANSISSLALVVAGVVLIGTRGNRSDRSHIWLLAGMLILAGLGSAAFHANGGTLASWLHDASLAGLLLAVAGLEVQRRIELELNGASWLVALAGITALVGLQPATGPPIQGILAAGGIALILTSSRERRSALLLPLAILTAGFGVYLLSRTGGPLCDPDSLLQGHAVWHVLAAFGLLLYGLRTGGPVPSPVE